jgi:DNA-directed RNA polymerase specialized sigma24 family protein
MKAQIAAQLAAHQKQFLSFLQPRLGGLAAAEDVLQAAYLRATEKADTIRDDESSVAWFYRLLRNAVTDVRRGAAREKRVVGEGKLARSAEEEPELKEAVCHCVTALAETLKPAHARLLRRVGPRRRQRFRGRRRGRHHAEQCRGPPAPSPGDAPRQAQAGVRGVRLARLPGLRVSEGPTL